MTSLNLKGIRRDVDYWVMLVYTYDKNYTNPAIAHLNNIPEPLKHMKPMGIQTGLEPEYTTLFDGSVTNYMIINENGEEQFIPSGHEALLNGASDNAQSSCLGCHANDFGRKSAMNQDLLGKPNDMHGDFTWKWTFYDAESYQAVKAETGPVTDFNLHLESAEKRSSRFLVGYCQERMFDIACTSAEYERAQDFVEILCHPGYDLEGPDFCEETSS